MADRFYGKDYPNRTMCEALGEMRDCFKSRNFAYLLGLIEEVQSMANRMEAGLSDKNDLEEMKNDRKRMNAELKTLQREIDKLREERDNVKHDIESCNSSKSCSCVPGNKSDKCN